MDTDNSQAVEPSRQTENNFSSPIEPEECTARTGPQPEGELAGESAETGKPGDRRWKRWGKKVWIGGGIAVITTVISGLLAAWTTFLAGPPPVLPPAAKPITNPGHLPGRLDVSTLAAGHLFYAVPNFYEFQSCGRPCWLPLYESPTEQSAFVTNNWPCEYYRPSDASGGPACVKPPVYRPPTETAEPADKNSGDKLLVVCQLTQVRKGVQAQTIHDQAGQSSDIWDMIAVPEKEISPDSPAAGRLAEIPGIPGFYKAYAPDMWLGNTGWHGIACK